MKLNHINLTVTDISAATHFLETYFGLRTLADNQMLTVLTDDDNLIFTLTKAGQVNYPNSFHIGFVQENAEQVNTIYHQLKDGGFEMKPPQRSHAMPGGKYAWNFYVQAPGSFMVEVLTAVD